MCCKFYFGHWPKSRVDLLNLHENAMYLEFWLTIRYPGFIPGVKRQLPKTKGTATYAYIIISLVKTKSVDTIVYRECLIQNCSTMGGLIAECGFF